MGCLVDRFLGVWVCWEWRSVVGLDVGLGIRCFGLGFLIWGWWLWLLRFSVVVVVGVGGCFGLGLWP